MQSQFQDQAVSGSEALHHAGLTSDAGRLRPAIPRDYVAMARPDHWIKHVFILPGIALALLLRAPPNSGRYWTDIFLGFLSAAAVASANYVLNEWLDARYDKYHPVKSNRPAVISRLSPGIVYLEYVGLVAFGLIAASFVSALFWWTAAAFVISGLLYNVPPVRTKDKAYLDVLSESINNPLRLTLGWAMIDGFTIPPSSLLLAYWMGGAYLMAIKRLAEQRAVAATGSEDSLVRYRRSFRHYPGDALLISSFVYAQLTAFFLAVFLVKYRIEYLLTLPLVAALFGVYFRLGLQQQSPAQTPERLFRQRGLMIVVGLLVAAFAMLTWVDIPALEKLMSPHYIDLSR